MILTVVKKSKTSSLAVYNLLESLSNDNGDGNKNVT